MQFCPSCCCRIILATAVIHNMCIYDKTELPEDLVVTAAADDIYQEPPSTEAGTAIREKLIRDVFS